ncbi:3-methyl-2-oxobutanoate hydroxymethyltransferase [Lacisediminimonas sp.]|uniref:3-methyl-2-oxobutanoate hydroxymethyltransferase n=1 Tax=Lacisediminimonas sp. TaxID=3060582 RepID=UPI00271ADB79|nr:3-methyl-2-oxobutanoate hydroxymethyltransferase [Lacisediminimonas sp.]MDO8298739.1 3-methyl-2-oxobutanoate hydroxymethyltransferase [Lacisediminimonas sp.]MDO9215777.1 3-methyl-2-oxobutanoate hydroxymethyltransferase [Lacisediminimonas sp.]
MSETKRKKVTIKQLLQKKQNKEMIVAIGVYDSPMAAIADEIGFDLLINGNAGPMSLLGHPTPLTVRYEEQLILTQAVSRVAKYGMVIGHMPYMTYNGTAEEAIRNAARFISEGGADAVKCEGNKHTAVNVAEIVRAGVPVMGHMGMQASRKLEQSGFGFKGRSADEAAKIVEDARAFVDAGIFAMILEYVPVEITEYLARTLPVPVISVGAGPSPDGIYLISGDAVGYSAFPRPKNEASFVDVRPLIQQGLSDYKKQVLDRSYPNEHFTQHMTEVEHEKFLTLVR